MFSRRPYVELSFSAGNRNPDSKFLSVQFIGADKQGRPVFAISTEPTLGMVSANSFEQVTESINVFRDELNDMDNFCIRADGDFR